MNLNLLPSQAKFQATRTKLISLNRKIMLAVTVVWVIVTAAVMIIDWSNKRILSGQEQKLKRVTAEYLAMDDNIIIGQKLKYKTKLVAGVLSSRFEYGKAFESVSKLFPESIKLDNYSVDRSRTFKINGKVERPDNITLLEDVVRAVNNGENEKFSMLRLISLGYNQGQWSFSMEAVLR